MPERTFRNVDIDLDDLADAVIDWFEKDAFEVQDFQEGPSIFIQARKKSLLTTLSGTGKALNVRLSPLSRGVKAEVGAGDWLDKGVGAGLALTRLIWWPLRISAGVATGYGIYQQIKLPEQLLDFIELFVTRHGVDLEERELTERRPRATPRPSRRDDLDDVERELEEMRQRRRGRSTVAAEEEPDEEEQPEAEATACPECGAQFEGTANFCPECGADLRRPSRGRDGHR